MTLKKSLNLAGPWKNSFVVKERTRLEVDDANGLSQLKISEILRDRVAVLGFRAQETLSLCLQQETALFSVYFRTIKQ